MNTNQAPGRSSWRRSALLALLAASACGGERAPEAPGQAGRPELTSGRAVTLADVQAVGLPNAAMPLVNLLTSGQPSPEQLSRLADLGYRNFISLRPGTEEGAGWEEAIASDEGIEFTRIPVAGAGGLTRENVEALDRLLDEYADEGAVLYCSSSNRVGALLALRAYWLDGSSPEEALALGREAGLRGLEGAVAEILAQPR
jgi:uncharacterized protein (TIGR01244 family)